MYFFMGVINSILFSVYRKVFMLEAHMILGFKHFLYYNYVQIAISVDGSY
jgi:hypothetical protein